MLFTFISILSVLGYVAAYNVSSADGCPLATLAGMNITEKFPDEYLVILYNNYTLEQHFATIGQNLSSLPGFRRFSFGYQAVLDDATRDGQVRRDPGVRMVETNRPVYGIEPTDMVILNTTDTSYNQTSRLSKRRYRTTTDTQAPYGLQMITTASKRLAIPISDGGNYEYLANAGQGVQAYVMDTGIRTTHQLFGGRARNFGGLGPNDKSPYADATMADVRGHGTHVAGIIGARTYGVAPLATLINVKVLDNYGKFGRSLGDVAEALHDIIAEHNRNVRASRTDPNPWNFRGSVINMSFSWVGNAFAILYQLMDANKAGISVYAAAGNTNDDESDHYPCANVQTRCIAAVDNTYNKARFSNYGRTVDFVAPGKDIISLYSSSDTQLAKLSGTSMASPHAAGAAAIFTSWRGLKTNADLSQSFVWWNSIDGVVSRFKSGTSTLLITTGIHSPEKYPNEPFRWGLDDPA